MLCKTIVLFYQHLSSTNSIKCGVPQGSILGPLLFLLYINDLPRCSPKLQFIMFADDTNIICSNKDPEMLENILNKELDSISNWFKLNKLSLNIDKTNFIIFKNKHSNLKNNNIKFSIDDKTISQVKTTKFLGILAHRRRSVVEVSHISHFKNRL
jgi:hypothetical protein